MKYRKLRIAWSVVWGSLAALLIVVWVRSYWWQDTILGHSKEMWNLTSGFGTVRVTVFGSIKTFLLKWTYSFDMPGFSYKRYPNGGVIFTFRYWFAVLIPGVLAATAWID